MSTINATLTSTFASAPEEYRDPNSVLRRAKRNVIYSDDASYAISSPFLNYSQSFEVKNRATGASVPVVVERIEGLNSSTIRLTFQEGNQVIRRAIGSSLRDGWYSLSIQGTLVQSQLSDSTMAANYLFGQSNSDKFYRVYGDLNGNQFVDAGDLQAMTRDLVSHSHQPRYIEGLDLDGNGLISHIDFVNFLRNSQLSTKDLGWAGVRGANGSRCLRFNSPVRRNRQLFSVLP